MLPSQGNYYEAGVSKAFGNNLRIDANYYLRDVANYADDDQIDNTTISFPIAFQKAIIYGAEGKIDCSQLAQALRLRQLFLHGRQRVVSCVRRIVSRRTMRRRRSARLSGHFPDSQDQRNTLFTRWIYQIKPRFWVAGGVQYGSGLPFDFQGTEQEALGQYGQQVHQPRSISRADGFILRSLLSASAGADVYKSDRMNVRFQVDGQNLTNVLDVIDFGGLFSGNAIGPARSFAMRLTTTF